MPRSVAPWALMTERASGSFSGCAAVPQMVDVSAGSVLGVGDPRGAAASPDPACWLGSCGIGMAEFGKTALTAGFCFSAASWAELTDATTNGSAFPAATLFAPCERSELANGLTTALISPARFAERADTPACVFFSRTTTFVICPLAFGIAEPRIAVVGPAPVDAEAAPTDSTMATVSAIRSSPPDAAPSRARSPLLNIVTTCLPCPGVPTTPDRVGDYFVEDRAAASGQGCNKQILVVLPGLWTCGEPVADRPAPAIPRTRSAARNRCGGPVRHGARCRRTACGRRPLPSTAARAPQRRRRACARLTPSPARRLPPFVGYRLPLRPGFRELAARLEQMLGNDLDVGQHRHEVRVPVPARHDVDVAVVDDARAGDAADVPADVESLG